MKIRLPIRREVTGFLTLTAGCALTALGISLFLVPNSIAAGGVTGLATIIHYWTSWPVGLVGLAVNVPLFLLGFRLAGSSFGFKTLGATVLLSLFIDLFAAIPPVTKDLLLAALAGGAMMGVGLGLVFRQDATTGGTDLAARIIHSRVSHISIAQVLLLIDVGVVLTAAFSFQSYELALYAVVTLVVTTRIIDNVTLGINFAKAAHIISSRSDEVAAVLLRELDRGVTGLDGRGLYTGKSREVLICVLKSREVPRLKRIVSSIDSQAFVYLTDVREVFGEGFQAHEGLSPIPSGRNPEDSGEQ
jgi:uncharacterized membrane-anchored protein YitT (DUF2179 family)